MAQDLFDFMLGAPFRDDEAVDTFPDVSHLGDLLCGDFMSTSAVDALRNQWVPILGEDCEFDWLLESVGNDISLLPQQQEVAKHSITSESVLLSPPTEESPGSVSSFGSPCSSGSSLPNVVFGETLETPLQLQFKILPPVTLSQQEAFPTDFHATASEQPVTSDRCSPSPARQLDSTKSKKSTTRKARKRVQNRDAATRYRVKKKTEQAVLDEQVRSLETQNKQLQGKADMLLAELNTLRSLWEDVQKASRAALVMQTLNSGSCI